MPDKTILLATDLQQSVLSVVEMNQVHPIAYMPYGHRPQGNSLLSRIGFNGQMPDPVTGYYHLGNGYRQYTPVLMRFHNSDSWSPFGKGGLNIYGYCGGDPLNHVDNSGHMFRGFRNLISDRRHTTFDNAQMINRKIQTYPYKSTGLFRDTRAQDAGFIRPGVTSIVARDKKSKIVITKNSSNGVFNFTTETPIKISGNEISEGTERLKSVEAIAPGAIHSAHADYLLKIKEALSTSKKGLTWKNLRNIKHEATIIREERDRQARVVGRRKASGWPDPSIHHDEPNYWFDK